MERLHNVYWYVTSKGLPDVLPCVVDERRPGLFIPYVLVSARTKQQPFITL
jgi:hypothetical protein